MNRRRVMCGTVILLEIAAAAALLRGLPTQEQAMLLFLAIHCSTSLLLAMAASRHAAHPVGASDSHSVVNGLFFFCIAFLIPVIGACISFAFLGRAIRSPTEEHDTIPVRLTGPPDLRAGFNTDASPGPVHAARNWIWPTYLKHAKEKERRLKALIAVRELPPRDAIALARLALTDPEDEVRLLAYTMLNVREEWLQGDIQTLTDQLAAAAPECRLLFHRALAHTYWETVYLGLASGAIESFMLEAALEHVEAAQREAPLDAGLRLLLGRILMRQGKLDQSAMAFSAKRNNSESIRPRLRLFSRRSLSCKVEQRAGPSPIAKYLPISIRLRWLSKQLKRVIPMRTIAPRADVTLLFEATYPYVPGGVANWAHWLIQGLPEIRFAVIFIGSRPEDYGEMRYSLPGNVRGYAMRLLLRSGAHRKPLVTDRRRARFDGGRALAPRSA